MRRILTAGMLLFIVFTGYGQQWKLKRMEGIFGVGTTNVYADFGGAPNAKSLLPIRDITFRNTRPSVYLGLRYRINPITTFKASIIYGFSKNEDYSGSRNEDRGFGSTTQLLEVAANYEYYFIPEQRRLRSAAMFNRRGMINDYSSFGAYVFIGVAGTLYWPNPDISAPRPGDKYKTTMGVTPSVPLGAGFKYIISDKWIFGWELGYRLTVTDYLDGFISPYSKNYDSYWISTVNLSYRIPTSRRGLPYLFDKSWRRARF